MQKLEKTIGFVSLGCDKNRVDLENIIYRCKKSGLKIINNPAEANIIIVNTCSFISSARQESTDNIIEMGTFKENAKCEKLIVTGCLNQMKYNLPAEFPEVDAFVKIADNEKIIEIIYSLYKLEYKKEEKKEAPQLPRVLTTAQHYAYLKIADGCNNCCTYCTIPYIRGRYCSTPINNLVTEAKQLASNGVKELILVAQDITNYGHDLQEKVTLVDLIKELSKIETIQWIRLLYCYPERITPELINEIKNNPKVCKYIDIPLQHINNNILKAMNRKASKEKIVQLIKTLKTEVPGITIRSTFIVGFPGETEEQFNELIHFLKDAELNYVGFFSYSREEGTAAAKMPNQISAKIKNARIKLAYKVQEEIIKKQNINLNALHDTVVVDYIENNVAIARSHKSSPNIDPVIFIYNVKEQGVTAGRFYKVKLTAINNNTDLKGDLL